MRHLTLGLLLFTALLCVVAQDGCKSAGAEVGAACRTAGGQCFLGGYVCTVDAPISASDCNPDFNPGGGHCCLSGPDAAVSTPDAGFAMDGASVPDAGTGTGDGGGDRASDGTADGPSCRPLGQMCTSINDCCPSSAEASMGVNLRRLGRGRAVLRSSGRPVHGLVRVYPVLLGTMPWRRLRTAVTELRNRFDTILGHAPSLGPAPLLC
jgi:hypothetical protein